ncbi:MAG: DUF3501 family protein [Polyangiales bacterium]
MRKVERSEILDLGAYEAIRPHFRGRMIAEKEHRRVMVGEHMTFLLENHDTVLLQIQEMMRTERISDERAIQHELDTYNELIPGQNELSATVLIAYEDPTERREMAFKLAGLDRAIHFEVGGKRQKTTWIMAPGEDASRVPAINYVRFTLTDAAVTALRDGADATLVVDHPAYDARATFPPNVRQAAIADLSPN